MSEEELRLANCQGKERLTAKVAKQLKVKYAARGRRMTPYKCRFCNCWHMGTDNLLRGEGRR